MMELDNSSELVVMDEGSNSNVGIDDTDPSPRGDDDDRRFVCNVCTFRFKRRFHLMRHMIKHTEDKFVNCKFFSVCVYFFVFNYHLRKALVISYLMLEIYFLQI